MFGIRKARHLRPLGHFWTFFFPVYFLAAAALDPSEVTNSEYLKFILATRRPAPEYWVNGRYPKDAENDPIVLVNFHEAAAYCRFVGRRLPSVDEWQSTCAIGHSKKARRYLGVDFNRRRYGRPNL